TADWGSRIMGGVYIRGRSVLHAGVTGKAINSASVTLCPPPPPAGPIPTPLPLTADCADLDDCAISVLVNGHPQATKRSKVKKCIGDGVARTTGGAIVTHVVEGEAYFVSYQMDVLIEVEPVPVHGDLMTLAHA